MCLSTWGLQYVTREFVLFCCPLLQSLASVLLDYSSGTISSLSAFMEATADNICVVWMPTDALPALAMLLAMLAKGPPDTHRMLLLLLQVLIRRTPLDSSHRSAIYAAVSRHLDEGTDCKEEALGVLEAILDCASNGMDQRADWQAASAAAGNRTLAGFTADLLPIADVAMKNMEEALARVIAATGGLGKKDGRRIVPFVETLASGGGSTTT